MERARTSDHAAAKPQKKTRGRRKSRPARNAMKRAQDRKPPATDAAPPPSATSTTKSEMPPSSSTASLTTSASSADSPPTSAEPLPETKAAIHAVQDDAQHERDAQDDETSPPQKFQRVPRFVCDAFDAAIREMDRRARQGVAEEDAHLGHYPRVTIASHITQEMLYQIPDEWLEDRGVELLPGRVLVNVYADYSQEAAVILELMKQIGQYASANNLQASRFSTSTLGTPNARAVFRLETRPSEDGTRPSIELAIFAADVDKRSGPEILVAVAKWLTRHPSVQCVIYLKFFSRRDTNEESESSIPAIGIVFRRGDGYAEVNGVTLCRVVIAETRSFGNASVSPRALDAFLAKRVTNTSDPHVLLQNPFDSLRTGLLQASSLFPDRVYRASFSGDMYRILEEAQETVSMRAELARLRAEAERLQTEAARLQAATEGDQTEVARARAERAHVQAEMAQVPVRNEGDEVNGDDVGFSVAMAAHLPPIRLDLITVFWNALQGHAMDLRVEDTPARGEGGTVESTGDGDAPMDAAQPELGHAAVAEPAVPAVDGLENPEEGEAWLVGADLMDLEPLTEDDVAACAEMIASEG